jgi:hypothetical protein
VTISGENLPGGMLAPVRHGVLVTDEAETGCCWLTLAWDLAPRALDRWMAAPVSIALFRGPELADSHESPLAGSLNEWRRQMRALCADLPPEQAEAYLTLVGCIKFAATPGYPVEPDPEAFSNQAGYYHARFAQALFT